MHALAKEDPIFLQVLSNEIHPLPLLALRIIGIAVGMNLLQQPRHIVGQHSHGLHTLHVLSYLAWSQAVGDVSVL